MNKKRRIFIGYILSKALQNNIEQWRRQFAGFPVRWIPAEQLHVTLVSPWYEQNVDEIASLLQSAQKPVNQFPILFKTITLGPDMMRPRLIWAKGAAPQELKTLKTYLTNLLKRKEEKRIPILHVTLSRLNKKQLSMFPKKTLPQNIAWKEKVTSFSLMESHLRRTGVVYETLVKIPL